MTHKQLRDWLEAVRRTAPSLKLAVPRPAPGSWQAGVRATGLEPGVFVRRVAGGRVAEVLEYSKDGPPSRPRLPRLKPAAFTPRLSAGLPAVFGAFHALHPVAELVSEWGAGGKPLESWSLRLKTGVPWPLFLRCDLAQPYAEKATELSFLMLDRKVVELSLSPEGMVAWNE